MKQLQHQGDMEGACDGLFISCRLYPRFDKLSQWQNCLRWRKPRWSRVLYEHVLVIWDGWPFGEGSQLKRNLKRPSAILGGAIFLYEPGTGITDCNSIPRNVRWEEILLDWLSRDYWDLYGEIILLNETSLISLGKSRTSRTNVRQSEHLMLLATIQSIYDGLHK